MFTCEEREPDTHDWGEWFPHDPYDYTHTVPSHAPAIARCRRCDVAMVVWTHPDPQHPGSWIQQERYAPLLPPPAPYRG
jgi:hypothetical protein